MVTCSPCSAGILSLISDAAGWRASATQQRPAVAPCTGGPHDDDAVESRNRSTDSTVRWISGQAGDGAKSSTALAERITAVFTTGRRSPRTTLRGRRKSSGPRLLGVRRVGPRIEHQQTPFRLRLTAPAKRLGSSISCRKRLHHSTKPFGDDETLQTKAVAKRCGVMRPLRPSSTSRSSSIVKKAPASPTSRQRVCAAPRAAHVSRISAVMEGNSTAHRAVSSTSASRGVAAALEP